MISTRARYSGWILIMIGSCVALHAASAQAWDSRTHELITRLAIDALPPGTLKASFERDSAQLEEFSIEPDTVLRPLYGKAEGYRHYIDLEEFGDDPFAHLNPDKRAMDQSVGNETLQRSGILPWAIEDEASKTASAWRSGDCGEAIRHAGYLAHYIGDASQPLHTTKFYDGLTGADRGMHARLEAAVDHRVREIEAASRGKVHPQRIDSVWAAVMAELQQSHPLIQQVVDADRATHAETGNDRPAYTRALMAREQDMVVRQIDDAASVLASVWMYEWSQADAPAACSRAAP